MKTNRIWNLALATGVAASLVGCAQVAPTSSEAPAPELPKLQAAPVDGVAPDQLVFGDRNILIKGSEVNIEAIRKQLPAKITPADASKMLVKIDSSLLIKEGTGFETQQRFGRFGHGFGRGFGFGGIHRGFGFGGLGRFGGLGWGAGWGGWGAYGGWGGLGWYPYGNFYFPYAYGAGCWSPVVVPVAPAFYSPFMYGYGGGFYPYTYGCGY